MPSIVSLDGAIVPRERAVVPVYDRGFLYGDTVFETLRAYRGEPYLLEEHLERLAGSAALVGIDLPVALRAIDDEVRAALAASGEADAMIRVTLSRGEGPLGLDPSTATRPRRVVFVEPLGPGPSAAQANGVSIRLIATRRAADLVPAAKVGAYLDAVVAIRAARSHGDDEAVVVDPSGLVVEATAANVFALVGGPSGPVLTTPPEGALLPGITRRRVLTLAREAGLAVAEAALTGAALAGAEEAFLTSSVREIVPITRVDGQPVGGGRPGPATRMLQAVFRAGTPAGAADPPPRA